MKREHYIFGISAAVLVILAAGVITLLVQRDTASPAAPEVDIGFGSSMVRGEVIEILESGTVQLGEITQPYQVLRVRIQEGLFTGMMVDVDYGLRQVRPGSIEVLPGETILLTISQMPDGRVSAFFADFVRTRPLLLLFMAFITLSVLISGWKGVRSLIGLGASFLVITGYILPRILAGEDPVLVSITGAFFILAFTLYITYGWTLKTHAAVLGTLVALIITGLLASFTLDFTRLTGFGSEDALFLLQQSEVQLNLRGLVLGGILIGALGVLDDLVITQSSVIFEIKHTAEHSGTPLRFWDLYQRGMRVGRDHVAATVNTLVLAYTGATLPTLLLFSLSGQDFTYLVNLEFVTEEIVRTLVGSIGLITAVPLATGLAAFFAIYQNRLGPWSRWLGPPGEGHTH